MYICTCTVITFSPKLQNPYSICCYKYILRILFQDIDMHITLLNYILDDIHVSKFCLPNAFNYRHIRKPPEINISYYAFQSLALYTSRN